MLPWASVAPPTHPDDHANARIEIQFLKRLEISFLESEKYITESSKGGFADLQISVASGGESKERCCNRQTLRSEIHYSAEALETF